MRPKGHPLDPRWRRGQVDLRLGERTRMRETRTLPPWRGLRDGVPGPPREVGALPSLGELRHRRGQNRCNDMITGMLHEK